MAWQCYELGGQGLPKCRLENPNHKKAEGDSIEKTYHQYRNVVFYDYLMHAVKGALSYRASALSRCRLHRLQHQR